MNEKIERALKRGLTVADLIDILGGYEPDTKVVFAVDYGDYTHTTQALPVVNAEPLPPCYDLYETAYSRSRIGIKPIKDNEDEEDEAWDPDRAAPPEVIVLSFENLLA